MPLMLLCPGALEILERLSFCWCVSEGKREVRLGLRVQESGKGANL